MRSSALIIGSSAATFVYRLCDLRLPRGGGGTHRLPEMSYKPPGAT